MKNKKMIVAMALLSGLFIMGCYKVTTLDLRNEAITGDVSFLNDVIPIFEVSCATSGCHSTGGIAPDLTAGNAFTSLSNGGYIDVTAPESSVLYEWLTGVRTPVMPISGSDPTINATVLAWINQGAQNN